MWIAAMIFGGGLLLSSAVAESVPRTGRAWLPGAMVEVEVVEPVLQREWKTRLEDLVVEVKKVFSGPRSLQGVRIRVNPSKVSRFPPKRWCALGMSGISGQSVDAYPPGRSGLLWIFQRRELLTSSSGGEFSFPTGFSPRWEPVKGRLREEVERHLHREWKHTRSLMRKVKGLRGMQEDKIKQKVLSWIAHDNPALRKWAIATLIRVKGMRVFPWVESIRNSEHVPSGLDRLADTIQSCATWRRSGDPSEKTLSLPPMLGVEILTKEKWSGARNILNPPTLEEPGSVKILRVFSGSGYEAGEILSASTGNFLVGEKILSLPLDGEVAFEPQHVKPQFRFPPRGRWGRRPPSLEPVRGCRFVAGSVSALAGKTLRRSIAAGRRFFKRGRGGCPFLGGEVGAIYAWGPFRLRDAGRDETTRAPRFVGRTKSRIVTGFVALRLFHDPHVFNSLDPGR